MINGNNYTKSVYYLRYSELEIFDIIQFVINLLILNMFTLTLKYEYFHHKLKNYNSLKKVLITVHIST